MKIWIDGYEANQDQRVGSGQYGFEILRNLEKIDKKNEYTILLPGSPLADLPKARSGWKYKILKFNKFKTWLAIPLALHLSKEKPDVFFSPTHYIPRFSSVKKVCTIFDLAFLHFPEMFKTKDLWQLKLWTEYSIKNSDKILAISEFTKQDIIKNYHVDADKIFVTPLGYDKNIFKPVKNAGKIKKPYIIYIGTIQPRKNLIRLMEAVARIEGLKLIIVGKTGWEYEAILLAPKKLGIEDRVEFKGFLPTEKIVRLLNGALAFILPSLYEGFGITVVEAMASGCPVIVSNVSSLPEVVGNAGLLVDPYSVDQIEQAIRILVSDKKLREKYVKLGLDRAKQFSWSKMAKTILKVLQSTV